MLNSILYSDENRCGSFGKILSKLTERSAIHINNFRHILAEGKIFFRYFSFPSIHVFLSKEDASKTILNVLTGGFISVQADSLTNQKALLPEGMAKAGKLS